MASNTSDKYNQIYLEAKELSSKTSLLKKCSRLLLASYAVVLLFILFFLFALFPFLKSPEPGDETMMTLYSIVFILFVLVYFGSRIINRKTKRLYLSVQSKCGELSDMVDWTTMRKRQLYHQLDARIQQPIDEFYEYSISKLCPYHGGLKLFTVMHLLLSFELLFCVVLTLIWTYKGI